MKIIIILTILFSGLSSSLFAKQCYTNKYNKICYYKYFDRNSIYKAKDYETYYLSKKNNIFAFTDKIEVKFKAFGAILSVLDNFEIEFIDKIKEVYIFKVKYPNELFSIVSRLNKLDTVSKAIPSITRKYTKSEISLQVEAKKERLKRALEKHKAKEKNSDGSAQTGGSKMGKTTEPRNFLNPDAN